MSGGDRRRKDGARDTARRVSRDDLILEDFLRLSIQFVRQFVDPRDLVSRKILLWLAKQAPDGLGNEGSAICGHSIDLCREILALTSVHLHVPEKV